MAFPRSSGILLHPTSLPGRFGCGDLGPEAYRFIEFLVQSRQQLWQVLPLGPTGYGDSPYQCFSTFAGNPLLISPEALVEEGLLSAADLAETPRFPDDQVDYGPVIQFRARLLARSFQVFSRSAPAGLRAEFEAFCAENGSWLEDFALFMALKETHGGAAWTTWEPELVSRQPEALQRATQALAEPIERHRYFQFQVFRQWSALKRFANERGVRIIGDIPIFAAHDSADVWANPDLFYLDQAGRPTVVAGVPPDYFSETGQLWGNPLYRWQAMKDRGYAWWIARVRATLALVDIIRLDHFRGFEAYWEIPAGEKTAIKGRWVKGPGADLFHALRFAFNVHQLPLIAEDLGVITPEVVALREEFELPGMKILQFAFSGGVAKMDAPYQYPRDCVVYTGTHDNDTALGWFKNSSAPEERAAALKYMGSDGCEFNWDFIRLAFSSVADMAVVPLQDVLGLGSEARMNYPSQPGGNWRWRYLPGALADDLAGRLAELTELYGRAKETPEKEQEG
ncbi:MAG: 4-alpha-glucanotransferase [Anaerolineae bacterium]